MFAESNGEGPWRWIRIVFIFGWLPRGCGRLYDASAGEDWRSATQASQVSANPDLDYGSVVVVCRDEEKQPPQEQA